MVYVIFTRLQDCLLTMTLGFRSAALPGSSQTPSTLCRTEKHGQPQYTDKSQTLYTRLQ